MVVPTLLIQYSAVRQKTEETTEMQPELTLFDSA